MRQIAFLLGVPSVDHSSNARLQQIPAPLTLVLAGTRFDTRFCAWKMACTLLPRAQVADAAAVIIPKSCYPPIAYTIPTTTS